MPARDLLTFVGIEVFQIAFGDGRGPVLPGHLISHCYRWFGEDTEGGNHRLEFVPAEFLDREKGFIFPSNEHVADPPLNKSSGRGAGAGIEHRHVLIQARHEVARLGFVVLIFLQRVTPGRQVVPSRAAGCLRVGSNDRNVRLAQVIPVLDCLGIPFTDQENNGGGVR